MAQITLTVTGMHCPKCDARVEKAAGAIAGVAAVKANHETDTVELDYDGAAATLEQVKAAITEQDFVVED